MNYCEILRVIYKMLILKRLIIELSNFVTVFFYLFRALKSLQQVVGMVT